MDTPDIRQLKSFEEHCEAGRTAREEMDNYRWYLGDLASNVSTKYGAHLIEDFARETNIRKSTAYQYKQVSEFYPQLSTRVEYVNLSYSHFRDAMRLGKLDKALAFLEECSANGYACDEASYHLTLLLNKEKGSEPTTETDEPEMHHLYSGTARVVSFDRHGRVVLDIDGVADLQTGQTVQITLATKRITI